MDLKKLKCQRPYNSWLELARPEQLDLSLPTDQMCKLDFFLLTEQMPKAALRTGMINNVTRQKSRHQAEAIIQQLILHELHSAN